MIRGFDAMHVTTTDGANYLLASADACVPYRTTMKATAEYRSEDVVDLLDQDFRRHGAPLVLRLDRASVHRDARGNRPVREPTESSYFMDHRGIRGTTVSSSVRIESIGPG